MTSIFKTFLKASGGSVAAWAALTTPVLIGGAALSVDVSRVYNMDGDLQAASDALARAGAAELDQRGDSIARSTRAINNMLKLEQKFADRGKGDVSVDRIRFLTELPANDYDEVPASSVTNDPSKAKYVEVSVTPEKVITLFPPSIASSMADVTLEATSVAGMNQTVCGGAPIYVCNPWEDLNQTIYEAMGDPDMRRRQIQFKGPSNGGGGSLVSGGFGWLDPYGGGSGASLLADAIAIDKPDYCISQQDGVVIRSGNISSMRHGLNTRFDIYSGSFKSKRNDIRYAPAANVVKGYALGSKVCKPTPSSLALGLPRDDCFLNGSCSSSHGSMGDGNWDFVNYMRINHSMLRKITIENVTYRINYTKNTFTPSAPPSRYAMYRWEIDNDNVPGAMTYGNQSMTPEEGLPTCHSAGASETVEDRRILHVAILNCGAIEAKLDDGSFTADAHLPVETFVKVFVTEPMDVGGDAIIWGEMVGPVVEGDDEEAHDQVELKR